MIIRAFRGDTDIDPLLPAIGHEALVEQRPVGLYRVADTVVHTAEKFLLDP